MDDRSNVPAPVELSDTAAEFAALTFPGLAVHLRELRPPLLALGLRDARADPAGLLLGSIDRARAQLLSVYVRPDLRGAGRGKALLQSFERLSARKGIVQLWAEYGAALPGRPSLEPCLAKAGWEQPYSRGSRFTGRIGDWLVAGKHWPGLRHTRDERAGIAFSPWRPEYASTAAVRAVETQRGFLAGLSPSRQAQALDLSTSIAIVRQGAIVGWVLAGQPQHRFDASLGIRWPAAYVTEDLWRTGVLIRACWHSLALAGERHGADVTAMFYAVLPAILSMARRRLADVAVVTDIIEARKTIAVPPD